MILHVTNARHLDAYRLSVTFNDGRRGVADLSEVLHGPVFEELKDPSEFAAFSVDEELETLVWPNGTDLAPEYLYYLAFKNDPDLQERFVKWGYTESAAASSQKVAENPAAYGGRSRD